MAESTPAPGERTPETMAPPTPPAPVPIRPSIPAFPSAPPDDSVPDDAPASVRLDYRPLSLPVIIGFGLAALYVAMMGMFALIALLRGVPMFWPVWTLFFPIAPLVLNVIGYLHVQRSENTRAGGKLAQFGATMSLLVGLIYASYYAAVYFVVRAQASACAERFFDALKKNDMDEAFALHLHPERRPSGDPAQRHKQLEQANNEGGDPDHWEFRNFPRIPFFELIRQGGQETKIERLEVRLPEYNKGGYLIAMAYRASNSLGSADIALLMFGNDNQRGRGEREWMVGEYRPLVKTHVVDWSDQGIKVKRVRHESSLPFAKNWLRRAHGENVAAAYLGTRAALDRQAILLAGLSALGGAPPFGPAAVVPALPGFAEFLNVGFVTVDKERFYDPSKIQVVQSRLGQMFKGSSRDANVKETLDETGSDLWHREGDVLSLEHDLHYEMHYFTRSDDPQDRSPKPTYVHVDGMLMLEGDAKVLDDPDAEPHWRVLGIRLVRAREIAPPKKGSPSGPPQGPAGMPPR